MGSSGCLCMSKCAQGSRCWQLGIKRAGTDDSSRNCEFSLCKYSLSRFCSRNNSTRIVYESSIPDAELRRVVTL